MVCSFYKAMWILGCACTLFFGVLDAQEVVASNSLLVFPDASETVLESEPNARGETILRYGYLKDEEDELGSKIVALKKADGTIVPLYENLYPNNRGGKGRNVTARTIDSVLWVSDDSFAFVSSGHMRSFYTVYRIYRTDSDIEGMFWCPIMVTGHVCFRVTWAREGGYLVAKYASGEIVLKIKGQGRE